MKLNYIRLLTSFIILGLLSVNTFAQQTNQTNQANQTDQTNQTEWPKILSSPNAQFKLYQPQFEHLENNILKFRMAISVQQGEKSKEQIALMKGDCQSVMQEAQKTGKCANIKIDNIVFPTTVRDQDQLIAFLRQNLESKEVTISSEELAENLKVAKMLDAHSKTSTFNNDPPTIDIASEPTALVLIDGEPQLRKIPNSKLLRVINTAFIIFMDTAKTQYYLRAGKFWMASKQITGPWLYTETIPPSIQEIMKNAQPIAEAEKSKFTAPPKIIVSTKPATLIQLQGEPTFSPIAGTDLLYTSNANEKIIFDVQQQHYYALLSGRWYVGNSLKSQSPWEYIDPKNLPPSFAKIPSDSAVAAVRSNIPGTAESEAAVLHNETPQIAKVKRSTAKVEVKYDGKPKFKPIKGTSIQYATNTANTVLFLNDKYYCVYQGVWFVASNPTGPWSLLDTIPDEIYSIPPSSPAYNATYTYISRSDPEYVYVGYTPGYTGSYLYENTPIYGTGYLYPGWSDNEYYGYPMTWGLNYGYQPYDGWNFYPGYLSPLWFGLDLARTAAFWGGNWGWNNGWYGAGYDRLFANSFNQWNIGRAGNVYNRWDRNVAANRFDNAFRGGAGVAAGIGGGAALRGAAGAGALQGGAAGARRDAAGARRDAAGAQRGTAAQRGKAAQGGKAAQRGKAAQGGKAAQRGKAAQGGKAAQRGKAAQGGKAAQRGKTAQRGKATQHGAAGQRGMAAQRGAAHRAPTQRAGGFQGRSGSPGMHGGGGRGGFHGGGRGGGRGFHGGGGRGGFGGGGRGGGRGGGGGRRGR